MRIRSFCHAILAVAALSATAAVAQTRVDVYALTNARIVTVSGSTIEKGTVVVRNGLIESVGAGVAVPADARVIDATGHTVYPGFIDALSSAGIPAAAAAPRQQGGGGGGFQPPSPVPTSNINYPQGLQPEVDAVEQLRGGDGQFDAVRAAGFTTALTVGREGVFNGQSAVINLAGESVASMVVRTPVGLHFTFRTIGGTYPGSLLGTFSAFRQMMHDSKRLWNLKKAYAADPKGLNRPEADRSLEALFPVLEGKMPLVINAVSEREILRALDLFKEFGVKGIIAGGHEADRHIARIKAQGVSVIYSLNYPKRTTSASADADPEPIETLRARANVPKAVASLVKAGVPVAFTSGGVSNPSDAVANAARSVEDGLAKDAAVRAMTLGAAEILGIADRTGSIDAGKIANLTVVKGDLFGKDRFVSHVFVDGRLFEQKERPRSNEERGRGQGGQGGPSGPSTIAVLNVAGTYTLNLDIPGQALTATLTLAQQGTALTGTLQAVGGAAEIKNGRISGEEVSFAASVNYEGMALDLTVSGRVSGDQMTGTINSAAGPIAFSGRRNP
jgi:imidazolonepropionase-like amidohydrolase